MSRFAVAAALLSLSVLPALAAPAPTQADVKAVIEKINTGTDKDYTFRSIQIANPRAASAGEIRSAGLPPKVQVSLVKADFTQQTGGGWGRDHVQFYLFYKDDFGAWTAQATSMPGNFTSEPHKVP